MLSTREITASEKSCGILERVDRVEQWRRKNDVVYRLLTNPDDTELVEYVAGLLQPGTGLLRRKYASLEAPRYHTLVDTIATLHVQEGFSTEQRRTSYHFLIFAAMASECDFVSYLVRGVWNRERFRVFVTQRLQQLFADLLQGNMTTGATPLETFVSVCRCEYMLHCLPKPLPDVAPEANPRA